MTNERHPSRRFLLGAGAGLASMPFWPQIAAAEVNLVGGGKPGGGLLPDRAVGRPMPDDAVLPSTPPVPQGPGPRIGIAVMGLGRFALTQIMPRIAESAHCQLTAVISGNPDKAKKVAAAYGLPDDAIYSYDTMQDIANDDRVDAIYIVLPSGLHAEWTVKSFAAGKHVLCEKPLAMSSDECAQMIASANAAGKKFMTAYRCFFEPHNIAAIDMIRRGEIGDIQSFSARKQFKISNQPISSVWRLDESLGGGPLHDYGIYGLNGAAYITGQRPNEISATIVRMPEDPRFREIPAKVFTHMRYPSGLMARVDTSYDGPNMNDFVIVGSGGVIRMHPATGYRNNTLVLEKDGDEQSFDKGDSTVQFVGMLDHFASAVLNGTEIIPTGEMGMYDIRIIEAIYQSAARGRAVAINQDGTMKG